MMMRLQKYDFEVRYQQGTRMHIADTLSRAFLPTTDHPSGAEFENVNMAKFLPISSEKLEDIQKRTDEDESLQMLKQTIIQGWPKERKNLPIQITPYFSMRDELTVQDGLIFRGQRIVILLRLRREMKKKIHSSHLGTESCLRRARECLYWPGMSAEIKEMVASCETCRTYETTPQKESLMPHETPSRPWEQVGVDLFTLDNKDYLITVDYYSNFWEVDRLTSTKTAMLNLKLKNHFARYGCPDRVISDNGPQFAAEEFATFAGAWDFEHRTSSPGNSKANGKAESAVKTAKMLIRKALEARTDPYLAILDYRNTPTQGMESSPVQRLMNRRTRTLIPTTATLLQPGVAGRNREIRDLNKRQEQQAKYYNRTAKDLPKLEEGEMVRMKPFRMGKKTWDKAMVTTRLDERSYIVETPEGKSYRRNRGHLKKSAEKPTRNEPI
jgi:transposase InsO family protein